MNPAGKKSSCGEHATGHGKPPGGRQLTALLLEEAYRPVCVREGDEIVTLPAIQAVLRSHFALAIKGNWAAQRSVIEAVQAVEQGLAIEAAAKGAERPKMSNTEIARRILFIFEAASFEGEPPSKPNADSLERDRSPSAS
jgi:hypothetical protein